MNIEPSLLRRAQLRDAALYWVIIPGWVILSGLLLDPLLSLPPGPTGKVWTALALGCLIAGLLLIQRSIHDLKHIGAGTPNPLAPPCRLVTRGVFALCRHPMFLGYDLAAFAVILFFQSWAMLCFSFPVFLFLQCRYLRKEERILATRFETEFETYRKSVPFMIPGVRPRRSR